MFAKLRKRFLIGKKKKKKKLVYKPRTAETGHTFKSDGIAFAR